MDAQGVRKTTWGSTFEDWNRFTKQATQILGHADSKVEDLGA